MAVATSPAKSVLGPFKPDLFIEHETWDELARLLDARGGGSFGVSGPRGAGKSWMMERATVWGEEQNGLGVWFPSPSEYEATAFLAALSDVTATRYEQADDRRTGRTTYASRRRFSLRVLAAMAVVAVAAFALLADNTGGVAIGTVSLAAGLALAGAAWLMLKAWTDLIKDRSAPGRVRRDAEELRQQVRYIVTTKESSELGGDAAPFGIAARIKRARERELVERPATLSSLVHNFRAFVKSIADVSEAPGALRTRNEFNSSFYTVLSMPALTAEQTHELLFRRDTGFDEELATALCILGGGIPREIVRMANAIYRPMARGYGWKSTVVRTMQSEIAAFTDDVLAERAAHAHNLHDDEKLGLWRRLTAMENLDVESFPGVAFGLHHAWSFGESPAWDATYREQWRRLIVRMAVAGLLVARPERLAYSSSIAELQAVVTMSASTAVVARARLARYVIDDLRASSAVQAHEPNDSEVDLVLYLLAHPDTPVSTVAPGMHVGARNALLTFDRLGILSQVPDGRGDSWKLADEVRTRDDR